MPAPAATDVGRFIADGKVAAVVCHATCVLLDATTPDGEPVVAGRTWTGFANSEEAFADEFVGQRIQPFWIEDEAAGIPDTNFIVQGRFRPHARHDGNLVTGQQQYSGTAAAHLRDRGTRSMTDEQMPTMQIVIAGAGSVAHRAGLQPGPPGPRGPLRRAHPSRPTPSRSTVRPAAPT